MSFSGYQSGGGLPSPPQPDTPERGSRRHAQTNLQLFHEPDRDAPDPVIQAVKAAIFGLPPWIVRFFFRIRNAIVVYSFFLYCLNALLNLEIYREYIRRTLETTTEEVRHGHRVEVLTRPAEGWLQRSWLENLYILTLMAPLADVLSRVIARNFFKLALAKSMSHASFAASLGICCPSLNTDALLILRGSSWAIFIVLFLDVGEVVYSLLMWNSMSGEETMAMWLKLGFIATTGSMWIWDVVTLFQLRRFLFHPLPAHINPIYVLYDANELFHWSSPNSILDLLEAHEDPLGPKCTSRESLEIRRRIARWNKDGERADPIVAAFIKNWMGDQARIAGPRGGTGSAEESDEEEQSDERTRLN
jgi:hypothetical protein